MTQKKKEKPAREPLKFDGIPLQELETKIETLHIASRELQKEMYEVLEYLRITKRYKENPVYVKSTFWQYLEDRFTIRPGTYRENVFAFTKHPEASVQLGVGLVSKINRLCGNVKAKKVIDEIQKAGESSKKPLPRAKIETVIQKNTDPERLKKREITDWKAMYEAEISAHENTKESLRVAVARVKELEEQVERLKMTASMITSIREIVEKPRMSLPV